MTSLGETFRRERAARGISLEEIAEETKIGIRQLRAIENEQFDQLPGGIFNRSFVRQYARYLGLEEDAAVREFLQATAPVREPASPQRPAPPEPPAPSPEPGYARVLIAAVLVGAVIAGIAYGLYRFREHLPLLSSPAQGDREKPAPAPAPPPAPLSAAESSTEPSRTPVDFPPVANPEAAPSAPSGSVSRVLPAAPLPPAVPGPSEPRLLGESAAAGVAPEGLRLRIDARGPVWLSITADGQKQWQGTLHPNQSRQVQAAESVRLTVGDAGAVELNLNGKPLPSLGRAGEVKTVTITAKGTPEPAP